VRAPPVERALPALGQGVNSPGPVMKAPAAQPDLILLDIHRPDLDGLTVARRLRAEGSVVSVIAITALAMPEDRERCLAPGADDYLSKPVSLGELTCVIIRRLKLEGL
jgi:CheY-like chemotaxis protein